ncbi:MAG: hypothetical protein KYX62_05295 [Pseudomonadota bacterium]|nr:hypothetical protein [Pseudomonadota bacterium]
METSWSRLTGVLTALTAIACCPDLQADTSATAYYSQNIDDAVSAARSNPVDTEYVGASWYNRSTSRSFALPRMLNSEMDNEVIEGAMGPTAAGEAAAVEAQQPLRDASLGRQVRRTLSDENNQEEPDSEDEFESQGSDIYIREARSKDSRVSNVRASVSIKASARP